MTKLMNLGLLVLASAVHSAVAAGVDWSYADESSWANDFAFCGGDVQSPINVDRFSTKFSTMKPFRFFNYDDARRTYTVKNSGYSLVVEFSGGSQPMVAGGGLSGRHSLASYHFHWGSDGTQGSEHTINSVRYPMELHLVHYKKRYGNLGEAINRRDGLAVLGIMFVISTEDNPALAPLIAHLTDIKDYSTSNKKEVTDLKAFSALLPEDTEKFYRYQGSLTTPTCNEVVTWTVFKEPITVSEAQMTEIRSLQDSSGNAIVNNYRQLQSLNGREVLQSFE